MQSTKKAGTFDFEIDYEQVQAFAEHGAAILSNPEFGIRPIILYWMETDQWCQVCDVFGQMIRGVDWPMEVGAVAQLDDLSLPYHPQPIPCLVYVESPATHADAEALAGRALARRKHYYWVTAD